MKIIPICECEEKEICEECGVDLMKSDHDEDCLVAHLEKKESDAESQFETNRGN